MIYTEGESGYLVDSSQGKIRGLILTAPQVKDTRIVMLKKKRIPFVVIGRTNEKNVYSVDNDNIKIGYELTLHLLNSGSKKIGFINGPAHFTVSHDRLQDYKKVLEENKIPFDETIIKYGDFLEKTGYENAKKLIEKEVTSILCGDDFIALGVLKAVKEKGLRIPEDIKIAGCNNSVFTSHINPSLTTYDIFPRKIGQKAAEKLMKLIKKEEVEERTIIKGKLIIRKSIGNQKTNGF